MKRESKGSHKQPVCLIFVVVFSLEMFEMSFSGFFRLRFLQELSGFSGLSFDVLH